MEYTKGRVQFERAIATYQAVQHRLADAVTAAYGARLLCRKSVMTSSKMELLSPRTRRIIFTCDGVQRSRL